MKRKETNLKMMFFKFKFSAFVVLLLLNYSAGSLEEARSNSSETVQDDMAGSIKLALDAAVSHESNESQPEASEGQLKVVEAPITRSDAAESEETSGAETESRSESREARGLFVDDDEEDHEQADGSHERRRKSDVLIISDEPISEINLLLPTTHPINHPVTLQPTLNPHHHHPHPSHSTTFPPSSPHPGHAHPPTHHHHSHEALPVHPPPRQPHAIIHSLPPHPHDLPHPIPHHSHESLPLHHPPSLEQHQPILPHEVPPPHEHHIHAGQPAHHHPHPPGIHHPVASTYPTLAPAGQITPVLHPNHPHKAHKHPFPHPEHPPKVHELPRHQPTSRPNHYSPSPTPPSTVNVKFASGPPPPHGPKQNPLLHPGLHSSFFHKQGHPGVHFHGHPTTPLPHPHPTITPAGVPGNKHTIHPHIDALVPHPELPIPISSLEHDHILNNDQIYTVQSILNEAGLLPNFEGNSVLGPQQLIIDHKILEHLPDSPPHHAEPVLQPLEPPAPLSKPIAVFQYRRPPLKAFVYLGPTRGHHPLTPPKYLEEKLTLPRPPPPPTPAIEILHDEPILDLQPHEIDLTGGLPGHPIVPGHLHVPGHPPVLEPTPVPGHHPEPEHPPVPGHPHVHGHHPAPQHQPIHGHPTAYGHHPEPEHPPVHGQPPVYGHHPVPEHPPVQEHSAVLGHHPVSPPPPHFSVEPHHSKSLHVSTLPPTHHPHHNLHSTLAPSHLHQTHHNIPFTKPVAVTDQEPAFVSLTLPINKPRPIYSAGFPLASHHLVPDHHGPPHQPAAVLIDDSGLGLEHNAILLPHNQHPEVFPNFPSANFISNHHNPLLHKPALSQPHHLLSTPAIHLEEDPHHPSPLPNFHQPHPTAPPLHEPSLVHHPTTPALHGPPLLHPAAPHHQPNFLPTTPAVPHPTTGANVHHLSPSPAHGLPITPAVQHPTTPVHHLGPDLHLDPFEAYQPVHQPVLHHDLPHPQPTPAPSYHNDPLIHDPAVIIPPQPIDEQIHHDPVPLNPTLAPVHGHGDHIPHVQQPLPVHPQLTPFVHHQQFQQPIVPVENNFPLVNLEHSEPHGVPHPSPTPHPVPLSPVPVHPTTKPAYHQPPYPGPVVVQPGAFPLAGTSHPSPQPVFTVPIPGAGSGIQPFHPAVVPGIPLGPENPVIHPVVHTAITPAPDIGSSTTYDPFDFQADQQPNQEEPAIEVDYPEDSLPPLQPPVVGQPSDPPPQAIGQPGVLSPQLIPQNSLILFPFGDHLGPVDPSGFRPQTPPGFDYEDFPEYDAVPPNLPPGVLRGFARKNIPREGRKQSPLTPKDNINALISKEEDLDDYEDSDDTLEDIIVGFPKKKEETSSSKNKIDTKKTAEDLTASLRKRINMSSDRLKKLFLKSQGIRAKRKSSAAKNCSKQQRIQISNIPLLVGAFSKCEKAVPDCGVDVFNRTQVDDFGTCLLQRYPETRGLDLSNFFTSGSGSLAFSSDDQCSNFIAEYFPTCGKYVKSCNQTKRSPEEEPAVIGCLFGRYPALMLPILTVEPNFS